MGKKAIIPSPLLEYKLRLAVRHLRRAARTDLRNLAMISRITRVSDDEINQIVRREIQEMRDIAKAFDAIIKRMEIPNEHKKPLPSPYR